MEERQTHIIHANMCLRMPPIHNWIKTRVLCYYDNDDVNVWSIPKIIRKLILTVEINMCSMIDTKLYNQSIVLYARSTCLWINPKFISLCETNYDFWITNKLNIYWYINVFTRLFNFSKWFNNWSLSLLSNKTNKFQLICREIFHQHW